MTALRNDSRGPEAGTQQETEKSGQDYGWSVAAEDDSEEIFRRKVVFAAAVAVVCCLGAWMLFTSALMGSQARPSLSATNQVASSDGDYTAMLYRCDDAGLESVKRILASDDRLQELAGPHEFWNVKLADGRWAVCVGRAEDEDSPELQRLVRQFRDFSGPNGVRPFRSADIVPCPR